MKNKHKHKKETTMLVVYPMTENESQQEMENIADTEGGYVIPETASSYAAIIVCGGTLPSSVEATNSGEVEGEEALVGGLIPVRPK